jgi:hypothetical protein
MQQKLTGQHFGNLFGRICYTHTCYFHCEIYNQQKCTKRRGAVARTYNPNYPETEIRKISVLPQPRPKKFSKTPSQSMKTRYCDPASAESLKEEDLGAFPPGQKMRSYLKSNQSKKDWRYGSSSREPPC